ncbi:MAG: diaminopimelate epimerase [Candidatus Mariimomonas ferrooxydans]
MSFTKMQALGNDFILIDGRKAVINKLSRRAKPLCDRRFGIGADQLLLLIDSQKADYRMRIFNADGSEVEMCGNGIRCLAKYIWDKEIGNEKLEIKNKEKRFNKRRRLSSNSLAIETLTGIIYLQKLGSLIKVDMGEPNFEPEKIPVRVKSSKLKVQILNSELKNQNSKLNSSLVKNFPISFDRKIFKITCVSMGNPHAVIVVKDVESDALSLYGPLIENHRLFPKKTNVEFIQILNRKNIKMRVWERGVGETMACGTGASAAGVASALLGLTDRKVTVNLRGGRLIIDWSEKDNRVYMTGPAVTVFEGTIDIK